MTRQRYPRGRHPIAMHRLSKEHAAYKIPCLAWQRSADCRWCFVYPAFCGRGGLPSKWAILVGDWQTGSLGLHPRSLEGRRRVVALAILPLQPVLLCPSHAAVRQIGMAAIQLKKIAWACYSPSCIHLSEHCHHREVASGSFQQTIERPRLNTQIAYRLWMLPINEASPWHWRSRRVKLGPVYPTWAPRYTLRSSDSSWWALKPSKVASRSQARFLQAHHRECANWPTTPQAGGFSMESLKCNCGPCAGTRCLQKRVLQCTVQHMYYSGQYPTCAGEDSLHHDH